MKCKSTRIQGVKRQEKKKKMDVWMKRWTTNGQNVYVKCHQAFPSVFFYEIYIQHRNSQHGVSKWFGLHFVWMKGKKWIWFLYAVRCAVPMNSKSNHRNGGMRLFSKIFTGWNRIIVDLLNIHTCMLYKCRHHLSSTVSKVYISLDENGLNF